MDRENSLVFGPFRLEATDGRLWRGAEAITLRPRSLAVLQYLVEHADRLVTKAELRQHVWAETQVTDEVLRGCIRDIRAALGDPPSAPQYLETVGKQGYRFLPGSPLITVSQAQILYTIVQEVRTTGWEGSIR
jgi:DNA-binding winged helix-turn-helix (wHTH) protein